MVIWFPNYNMTVIPLLLFLQTNEHFVHLLWGLIESFIKVKRCSWTLNHLKLVILFISSCVYGSLRSCNKSWVSNYDWPRLKALRGNTRRHGPQSKQMIGAQPQLRRPREGLLCVVSTLGLGNSEFLGFSLRKFRRG